MEMYPRMKKFLVTVEVRNIFIFDAEDFTDLMKKVAKEYLTDSSQDLYIKLLSDITTVQNAVDLYNKFAEGVFGTVTAIYEIKSTVYPSEEAIYGR